MNIKIPFFNYKTLFKQYEKIFIEIFSDTGRRGAYIIQKDLSDFESSIEKYTGVKHAIGVGTLVQWGGKAVHEFRDLGFTQSLPFTEKMMRSSLMLPLNMTVTDDEVKYVCKCVKSFFND